MTTQRGPGPQSGLPEVEAANGDAVAAILGAGIGSLAVGVFVLLNEAGIYAAPGVYAPAGGASGRAAFALIVWLLSWAVLHWRLKGRRIAAGAVYALALILIALGIVATFPPFWSLL
jgi:hypothetical protein